MKITEKCEFTIISQQKKIPKMDGSEKELSSKPYFKPK
jgi:hypothetical protein